MDIVFPDFCHPKNKVEFLNLEVYISYYRRDHFIFHLLSPIAKHTLLCLSQVKKTTVKILKRQCFMCHNEVDDSHKHKCCWITAVQ